MKDRSATYKPISAIRLTSIVILGVSLLFPLLVSYINDTSSDKLLIQLFITPLRLGGITVIAYLIIQASNKTIGYSKLSWLRYVIELPLIIVLTYFWLIWFLQHVEAPIVCNCV